MTNLQIVIKNACNLANEVVRIKAELDASQDRGIEVKTLMKVVMQRVWYVLAALDRVFSSHILATHLNPQSSEKTEMEDFAKLKDQLTSTANRLEPCLRELIPSNKKDVNPIQDRWVHDLFLNFRKTFTLERVIDAYLVKSSGCEIAERTSLQKSMLYKRTRQPLDKDFAKHYWKFSYVGSSP